MKKNAPEETDEPGASQAKAIERQSIREHERRNSGPGREDDNQRRQISMGAQANQRNERHHRGNRQIAAR